MKYFGFLMIAMMALMTRSTTSALAFKLSMTSTAKRNVKVSTRNIPVSSSSTQLEAHATKVNKPTVASSKSSTVKFFGSSCDGFGFESFDHGYGCTCPMCSGSPKTTNPKSFRYGPPPIAIQLQAQGRGGGSSMKNEGNVNGFDCGYGCSCPMCSGSPSS